MMRRKPLNFLFNATHGLLPKGDRRHRERAAFTVEFGGSDAIVAHVGATTCA